MPSDDPPIIVGGGGSTYVWIRNDFLPAVADSNITKRPMNPETYVFLKSSADVIRVDVNDGNGNASSHAVRNTHATVFDDTP